MTDARWDGFFLDIALRCAAMSKDPNTRVGAVLVGKGHHILGTGFNGLPRGIQDRPERLNDRETKNRLVVHAEMNAILAAARNGISTDGCLLFLAATDDTGAVWGGAPCTRCTVELIQAGIKNVVSYPHKGGDSRWAVDVTNARMLLAEAGIGYREIIREC